MKLLSTPPDPRCNCCDVAEDVKDGFLLTQGEVGATDNFVGDEDSKEVIIRTQDSETALSSCIQSNL